MEKWKSDHYTIRSELISDMSKEDKLEMLFEFIDQLHFIYNIALALKLTSKDIYTLYMLKNFENLKRYEEGY